MRRAMIVAGILFATVNLSAKGKSAATVARQQAAAYKKNLTAEAKVERAAVTTAAKLDKAQIEGFLAIATDPVQIANLRLQLTTLANERRAAQLQIAANFKLARQQAFNETVEAGHQLTVQNVLSYVELANGGLLVTVRDSEGGISMFDVPPVP